MTSPHADLSPHREVEVRLLRTRPPILATAVLVLALPLAQESGEEMQGASGLSAESFRREVEAAFDADDGERIEALVVENPTRFLPLFESYAGVWAEARGEPGPAERLALRRVQALSEAVDFAIDAPELRRVVEALERWDETDRERWREARAAYGRGQELL